jgi:hypothetical protein
LRAHWKEALFQGACGASGINMLWTIFVVLLVLWLLGLTLHIGGVLIHLLVILAVIILLYNLITDTLRSECRS